MLNNLMQFIMFESIKIKFLYASDKNFRYSLFMKVLTRIAREYHLMLSVEFNECSCILSFEGVDNVSTLEGVSLFRDVISYVESMSERERVNCYGNIRFENVSFIKPLPF